MYIPSDKIKVLSSSKMAEYINHFYTNPSYDLLAIISERERKGTRNREYYGRFLYIRRLHTGNSSLVHKYLSILVHPN
jgi:hypothetical protein